MTLDRLIRDARREYHAETPVRLHTHHASKLLDADGVTTKYPDEGGIGLPFTAEFHRLLALGERFSPAFLLRESLDEVRDWCRGQHPEHAPEGISPLCYSLVYAAVVGSMDPEYIALMRRARYALIESLLEGAMRHAEEWRRRQNARTGVIGIDYAAETADDRMRREHDLDHERRMWNYTRTKWAMPEWSDELARRRAQHRKGCGENCPLLKVAG